LLPIEVELLGSKFRYLVLDLRLKAEHLGNPEGVDGLGYMRWYRHITRVSENEDDRYSWRGPGW
jgi:hypothetical protein